MAEMMTPEEMTAMQKQKGEGNPQAITGLVEQVGTGLGQLAEMMNKLPQAGPEMRAAMMSAMEAFKKAVTVMQGGQAEADDETMEGEGAVAMEGGAKGVPMGPQMRQ
jgi:hypothetical protein